MVEWMGRNFDIFPGFQEIPCYACTLNVWQLGDQWLLIPIQLLLVYHSICPKGILYICLVSKQVSNLVETLLHVAILLVQYRSSMFYYQT